MMNFGETVDFSIIEGLENKSYVSEPSERRLNDIEGILDIRFNVKLI
jgi:hypothetical protein